MYRHSGDFLTEVRIFSGEGGAWTVCSRRLAAAEETEAGVAFELLHEVGDAVVSGCWVGACFLYTTEKGFKYYVGGEVIIVKHLQSRGFLLGYLDKESVAVLVDKDVVEESNINRQIVALMSTVGQHKSEIMRRRIADIDPACNVAACTLFYLPETAHLVPLAGYDYIADCIDNVTAKLHLITAAQAAGVPVVSAMGAGNKLDPARFRVSDLAETKTDPLARIMRRELKKRGVEHLPVVWSDELPMPVYADMVGSVSFVPSVMGLIMAGHIVKELAK